MRGSLPSTPRPSVVAVLALAALGLSACTSSEQRPDPTPEPTPESTQAAMPRGAELGVDTRPLIPGGRDTWEECPYLDTGWVENTNGQRVTGVGIDDRFQPPACVYWSYPDEPQLEVTVREMASDADAIAVVDAAAPIGQTEPAELPGDWMGGRGGTGMIAGQDGAVFAVQKGSFAVVVRTNQVQSFKAEQVAQEAITRLGL